MATIRLPRSLTWLVPGAPRQLQLEAATVEELIVRLDERWPGLRDRLCEPGPRLREHINVFVDGERTGLDAPIGDRSVVMILPAISGGASRVVRDPQPTWGRPSSSRPTASRLRPARTTR